MMQLLPCLRVVEIPNKGRGVIALEPLPADTLIECSPAIVMSDEERKLLDNTLLHDYIFLWGAEQNQCCMAQGYISIYNHSYHSNCEYFMDYDNNSIEVKTVRAIEAGEELTINYNGDWNDEKAVWFDVQE